MSLRSPRPSRSRDVAPAAPQLRYREVACAEAGETPARREARCGRDYSLQTVTSAIGEDGLGGCVIFLRSPERRIVEAVRRGKCQFALVIGTAVFYLMYRFGKAIGWSAAPYSGTMTPNEKRNAS